MLATVSAILLSVVIVVSVVSSRARSHPPIQGNSSNQAYCQYLEGPRAGQRDSIYSTSPSDPQKCTDTAGNEGLILIPGNLYPPVEAEEPVRLLPIIALALLVALGVGGTRLLILRSRRTEAQTIADRAVSYFSQLH